MSISFRSAVRAAAATASLLLLSACLSTPVGEALPPAPKNVAPILETARDLEPYRLQIGDVMDIKVMQNPEMNEQVTVRPDGMVSTVLAREVKAYGRTPAELQADLEQSYKSQLRKPQIAVLIRSFAPNRVYVTGEVFSPGEFVTIGPSLTLMQAIARAGGVKNSANTDDVVILRRGAGEKPLAYAANYTKAAGGTDANEDVRLAPYDVVYVPRTGVGNAYLHFQQYFQQFIPVSIGASYQLNPNGNTGF